MHSFSFIFFGFCIVLFCTFDTIHADDKQESKPKKDPASFTEDDINKLYEEWEKNDEEILPEDEQHDFYLRHPQGKRRPTKQEDLVGTDPDKLFATMKKGQTTMIFAVISHNPSKRETQHIADIWWTGLRNALYDVHRYVVDTNQIVFLVQDGSLAYEIKDYLIKQPRCFEVVIDNQHFPGRGSKVPKITLKEL